MNKKEKFPSLLEKQFVFSRLIVELIEEAYRCGYAITLGEVYRPKDTAVLYAKQKRGIKNSLHEMRLAIDLNLFKNGLFLKESGDYRFLGEYWESLSTPGFELCWGGGFQDGNHFSMKHNGIR